MRLRLRRFRFSDIIRCNHQLRYYQIMVSFVTVILLAVHAARAGVAIVEVTPTLNEAGTFSQSSNRCPQRDQVTSLNIGFSYPGDRFPLPGSVKDLNAFAESAVQYSKTGEVITDKQATSRESFLQLLREKSASAKIVNLNLAGHGFIYRNQYQLMLPGGGNCLAEYNARSTGLRGVEISQSQEVEPTTSKSDGGSAGALPRRKIEMAPYLPRKSMIGKPLPDGAFNFCQRFFVSRDEITQALAGKYIFGVVATCHGGAFTKGLENASFISAGNDREKIPDTGHQGEMSEITEQMIAPVNSAHSCDSPRTFADFAKQYRGHFSSPVGVGLENPILRCFKLSAGCGKASKHGRN